MSLSSTSACFLLFQFSVAQKNDPVQGDWCETVEEDMKKFGVEFSYDEISNISKQSFNTILRKKADVRVFDYMSI